MFPGVRPLTTDDRDPEVSLSRPPQALHKPLLPFQRLPPPPASDGTRDTHSPDATVTQTAFRSLSLFLLFLFMTGETSTATDEHARTLSLALPLLSRLPSINRRRGSLPVLSPLCSFRAICSLRHESSQEIPSWIHSTPVSSVILPTHVAPRLFRQSLRTVCSSFFW